MLWSGMLKPRNERRSSGSRSRVGSERMEPKHNLLRHDRTIGRGIHGHIETKRQSGE